MTTRLYEKFSKGTTTDEDDTNQEEPKTADAEAAAAGKTSDAGDDHVSQGTSVCLRKFLCMCVSVACALLESKAQIIFLQCMSVYTHLLVV